MKNTLRDCTKLDRHDPRSWSGWPISVHLLIAAKIFTLRPLIRLPFQHGSCHHSAHSSAGFPSSSPFPSSFIVFVSPDEAPPLPRARCQVSSQNLAFLPIASRWLGWHSKGQCWAGNSVAGNQGAKIKKGLGNDKYSREAPGLDALTFAAFGWLGLGSKYP
jgi:hypothetical protein